MQARRTAGFTFHELFIPALPKLPCLIVAAWHSAKLLGKTVIEMNHLASQPSSAIWHPICSTRVWRHRILAFGSLRLSAASAPAGSANLLAFFTVFGERPRIMHASRAGAEQSAPPNLEEVTYEAFTCRTAVGCCLCFPGLCAEH